MEKTKIAFFSEKAYTLFNPDYQFSFGGAEVDQYNLAIYLAKKPNIEVTFYVGDVGQAIEPEIVDGVRVQKIPMFGWQNKNLYKKVAHARHLFKTLWGSDADVVLTEAASDIVGWSAIFIKILKKKHLIHRLASDRDTEYHKKLTSKRRRTYYLYRLGLKKADLIISQTLQQQRQLKTNMGFDSQVVTNGFFIDRDAEVGDKRHILWVGRCTALKQPELFVEMARRIPHKSFIMIMPPPTPVESEEFLQFAAALVEKASALPNLTYIEHVPFNKIQQYYNQAQLLVNTSKYEGFPNTFVQACLGGTPIASLKVDPDGFITRNNLGFVGTNDFNQLVQFVENISSQIISHLGANALKYAKKYHDIRLMGSAYEEAINKLIKPDRADKMNMMKQVSV